MLNENNKVCVICGRLHTKILVTTRVSPQLVFDEVTSSYKPRNYGEDTNGQKSITRTTSAP